MPDVRCAALQSGMTLQEFSEQASEILENCGENTVVLVDLFGGTPSNVFTALARKYGHHVVTGLNLPMLIEAYSLISDEQEISATEVVNAALEALRLSGVHANEVLAEKQGSK